MLSVLLPLSAGVGLAQEALEPTAPAALRCAGLVEPGPPPDSSPGWQLVWERRWEVLSTDAVFRDYRPTSIAVDKDCNTWVGGYSPTGGRIVKLGRDGQTLATWGANGHGVGQFERLEGLAVDVNGNVYAADAANGRVQKFAPDGKVAQVWASEFGCRDTTSVPCKVIPQDAWFNGNFEVAVDGQGNVYVGDGYHGVKKFTTDGALVTKWGPPSIEFLISGISVDRHGDVWTVDTGHRVQQLSSTGTLKGQWGSKGNGPGQFNNPGGVAVRLDGTRVVADADNQRVQELGADGAPLAAWGHCWEGEGITCSDWGIGDEAGQFSFPRDVAVNGRGEVFVADNFNYRVQVLKAVPTWVQPNAPDEEGGAEE